MNIAFDAKRYFNNATGLGFYSRTLVDGLCSYYPEHTYRLYTPYNKGRLGSAGDNMRLPNTLLGRIFHPIWRSHGLTRQLKHDGMDVFHGLSHELPVGLRRSGIRSVVTMHDLIFLRYPALYPAMDRLFYTKKYRRSAEEADQVVAISQQTRADLEVYFGISPARVRVIGQSCDPAFARLSLRVQPDPSAQPLPGKLSIPEQGYWMAVGSLTQRKNWHRLLDALFILKNQGDELPLVAVGTGKGAYAEGLRAQAKRLGLCVYWIDGHISTEELARLYRRATALVYPSVFEGFGIPILEAMTIGIPVVTSCGGCFEEVGGAAALYADPLRVDDLAAQMGQVLASDVRKRLVTAGTAQINLFSPEKICAAWMDVYQHLV